MCDKVHGSACDQDSQCNPITVHSVIRLELTVWPVSLIRVTRLRAHHGTWVRAQREPRLSIWTVKHQHQSRVNAQSVTSDRALCVYKIRSRFVRGVRVQHVIRVRTQQCIRIRDHSVTGIRGEQVTRNRVHHNIRIRVEWLIRVRGKCLTRFTAQRLTRIRTQNVTTIRAWQQVTEVRAQHVTGSEHSIWLGSWISCDQGSSSLISEWLKIWLTLGLRVWPRSRLINYQGSMFSLWAEPGLSMLPRLGLRSWLGSEFIVWFG